MLFAGMSYPRASARICLRGGGLRLRRRGAVLGASSPSARSSSWSSLWTAGMCLWQARNRERQHDELERPSARRAGTRLADRSADRRAQPARVRGSAGPRAGRLGAQRAAADARASSTSTTSRRSTIATVTRAGDALLRETVQRLSGVLRPLRLVGRLGERVRGAVPRRQPTRRRASSSRLRDGLAGPCASVVRLHLLPGRRHPSPRSCSSSPTSNLHRQGQSGRASGDGEWLELVWATALAGPGQM